MLAVVSDTHGRVRNTQDAIRILESFDVDTVIHCGDIGSAAIPSLFTRWPTHFVLGNVDGDEEHLGEAIRAAGHTLHGRFGSLELEGRRIAFLHGDDERLLRQTLTSGAYDLVCQGHTHHAEQRQFGSTLLLNPGAIHRANPHSVAVVDLSDLTVTLLPF